MVKIDFSVYNLQNYIFFATFAIALTPSTMPEFDKKYYKISEVAEILDIPASTLRFWEKRFTVIKPRRSQTGLRFYTPSDIEKIRLVWFLVKDKGLKLEAAEAQLRNNRTNVSRRAQAIERLRTIRNTLQNLLDATKSLR